jgi:hypothetical protein
MKTERKMGFKIVTEMSGQENSTISTSIRSKDKRVVSSNITLLILALILMWLLLLVSICSGFVDQDTMKLLELGMARGAPIQ